MLWSFLRADRSIKRAQRIVKRSSQQAISPTAKLMSIQWNPISSEAELETILSGHSEVSSECFLLFKHSNRCAISNVAKVRLERNSDPRLTYFIIDVIGNREVSNRLSEMTEVRHESPQIFLFHNTQLIDVKSHMAISASEISLRLNAVMQIGI